MKKIFVPVFILTVLLFLTGCGTTQSTEEPSPGQIMFKELAGMEINDEKVLIKKLADARKVLKQEADQQKNINSCILLGLMYRDGLGGPQDSINSAKYLRMAADTGNPVAKLELARLWIHNEMLFPEAEKMICSIPGYEKEPDAVFLLAQLHYASGAIEKGFGGLKKAWVLSAKTPQCGTFREGVIQFLQETFSANLQLGQFENAGKIIAAINVLSPGNPAVIPMMVTLSRHTGKYAETEKYIRSSLRRSPGNPLLCHSLALIEFATNRFEDGFEHEKTAIAVSPDKAGKIALLQEICRKAKRMKEFEYYLEQNSRRNPQDPEFALSAGILKLSRKDYKGTLQLLEQYLDAKKNLTGPETAKKDSFHWKCELLILDFCADASQKLRDWKKAEFYYRLILEKNFSVSAATNYAEFSLVTGNYDEALRTMDHESVRKTKDSSQILITRYLKACGMILSGKDATKAVKDYRDSVKNYPAAKKRNVWSTDFFRQFLDSAKLSPSVKKELLFMTDEIESFVGKKAPAVKK